MAAVLLASVTHVGQNATPGLVALARHGPPVSCGYGHILGPDATAGVVRLVTYVSLI